MLGKLFQKKVSEEDKINANFVSELLDRTKEDMDVLVTVTGINYYFGRKPFDISGKVVLSRKPSNEYDKNAVAVYCDGFGLCGYVANSCETVKQGTFSADLINGGIGDGAEAEVLWVDDGFAICKLACISCFDLMFNQAVKLTADGEYKSALELLTFLEEKRDDLEILQRICDCHIKLKRYAKAKEYAERMLELDMENKISLQMMNVILRKLR